MRRSIKKDLEYQRIIKEAELKEKWLKNEEVTNAEIAEMIYIEKHIQIER